LQDHFPDSLSYRNLTSLPDNDDDLLISKGNKSY